MKLPRLQLWIGAALLFATFGFPPPVSFGQVPPPQPAPAAAEPAPATPDAPDAPVVERSIYLPYKDLQKVFENDGRGVFLPYREFLDLWNQLQVEQEEKKAAPPADGILASAQYTASIDGEVVKIDAALKVESFKEGWAVLPLIKAGLNIAEAETGKATLRLGEGGYELLLPEKGVYDLKLTIFSRITRSSGKNSARLNLPKTAVSKFEMLVPGQGWEFEINPGTAFNAKPAGENNTSLAFFFGEAEGVEVSWQKQGEATKLTPLIFAEVDSSSTAIAGALQSTAQIRYRILRAGVDSFEIAVPAPHEVLSVTGENLREWTIVKPEDAADAPATVQTLKVVLHAPAKDQFTLDVTFEAGLDQLPISIKPPILSVAGVVRQRGSVSLMANPELEVELKEISGLAQQAQAIAPAQPGASSVIGRYRYLRLPYDLTLDIKQAEPVVEVQSYTKLTVEPDAMDYVASFDYDVKRVGIFGTRIQIPAGFESVEATGEVVEDFAEVDEDGKKMLDVKFKSQASGAFRFQVTGRSVRDAAEDDVLVPVFYPQAVARHEGKIGLAIHTSLDPNTKELGGLRQEDVSQLADSTPNPLTPVTLGFRYRGEAAPATVSFKQKQPQISADVLISVEVREQLIRYEWTIGYSILYAGVDTFVIAVPTDHSAELREKGEIIKEIIKDYTPDEDELKAAVKSLGLEEGANPTENGFKFWKLVLRDKKMGAYTFTLSLEDPTKILEADEESSFPVPEIAPVGVFQENGQLAVVKEGNLEISQASAKNLEEIDPTELRGRLRRAGVFLAYKYKQHPLELELRVSKNQFLPVPEAVVVDAIVNTAVSADRGITSEVIYWVRNNSKQFFSIRLPKEGKMLADIYVNGEARQPMRRAEDAEEILVRLPARSGASGGEFPIRFVYSVPSPEAGKKLGSKGEINIAPVEVDANIIRTQLNLYLPDDYHYTSFESAMWEPVGSRGWATHYRNLFRWIVPALGPEVNEREVAHWDERTALGSGQAGFDHPVPREGQHVILRRLGAPDAVAISYLSKGYSYTVQALGFIIAFGVGLLLLRLGFVTKVFYFIAVGLGALVVGGAVYPRSAAFCQWIFIGVALAAALWLLVATGRWLGSGRKKAEPQQPSQDQPVDPEPEDKPEEESKPEEEPRDKPEKKDQD